MRYNGDYLRQEDNFGHETHDEQPEKEYIPEDKSISLGLGDGILYLVGAGALLVSGCAAVGYGIGHVIDTISNYDSAKAFFEQFIEWKGAGVLGAKIGAGIGGALTGLEALLLGIVATDQSNKNLEVEKEVQ